jgi:hypothetical protein
MWEAGGGNTSHGRTDLALSALAEAAVRVGEALAEAVAQTLAVEAPWRDLQRVRDLTRSAR